MITRSRSRAAACAGAIIVAAASLTALALPSHAAGGSIAGIVQDEANERLAAIDVTLYKKEAGAFYYWDTRSSNDSGKFRFGGLTAGQYRVCANDPASLEPSPHYFPGCWNVGTDVTSARTINLSDDQVVKARKITLIEGGTISGSVTGVAPAVEGETVPLDVVDEAGEVVQTVDATVGSPYSIGPFTTGEYRVQFGRASESSRYAGQFFEGLSELAGLGSATPVSVVLGDDTPGVDATMTTGGSINGFVKDSAGNPLRFCGVVALADDGVRTSRYDDTSVKGRFTITGLSPGDYKVVVLGCSKQEKWYDSSKGKKVTTVKADGELVTVTDGEQTGIGTLKVKKAPAVG